MSTERYLEGKLAVITGSSRGIGAEIAKSLAGVGVDIIGNYVDTTKQKLLNVLSVEQEVNKLGSKIQSVQADITEPEGRRSLLLAALDDSPLFSDSSDGVVDYLILNAAGGLEDDKPAGWPEKINIEAQLALVDQFLPHMKRGGMIVYITSLWAYKYGEVRQLPNYEPVARTKKAAELALKERIPEFTEKDIRLGLLVGHVIKGTAAHTLLKRTNPRRLEEIQETAEGGKFPTATDMGRAVRGMLMMPGLESGFITCVGGITAEPIDEEAIKAYSLNRSEISEKLPMYGPSTLLVDEFDSPEDKRTGIGRYTVREGDCEEHFTNDYRDIKLFRAVDQTEAATQTLGLVFLGLEPKTEAVPFFAGTDSTRNEGMIFLGDQISMYARITHHTGKSVKGDCEIKIGDTCVAVIKGINLVLAPDKESARKIIARQKAARVSS